MTSIRRLIPGRIIARLAALAVPALVLAACVDEPAPLTAPEHAAPGAEPGRVLGLVEVTITGLGSTQPVASVISAASAAELERLRSERAAPRPGTGMAPVHAVSGGGSGPGAGPGVRLGGALQPQMLTAGLPGKADASGDGTIQLEPVTTGSFTVGTRGVDGVRYLYATYRVRNAQADGTTYDTPRQNLTFYAVDTDGTIGETAMSQLGLFDGSAAAAEVAAAFVPTGATRWDPTAGALASAGADALQLLTEAEASSILALASADVSDVFPYGFVVRNPGLASSRTLPASPAAGQFDGLVTFAFKVPLQASAAEDPFTVSAVFMAVDDAEVSITQSPEEQDAAGTAAFLARAEALGANTLTFLPGGGAYLDGTTERLLCEVRVAGPAGTPTTTLFPTPSSGVTFLPAPGQPGAMRLPRTVRPGVGGCPTAPAADATSLVVHGSMSGRSTGAYDGAGTSLVRAPAASGGDYFAGEEIEVTWTGAVTGGAPRVAHFRTAATGGSGTYSADSVPLGFGPLRVAAADLDGDGDIDLAAVNEPADYVEILLNDGTGTFSSAGTVATRAGPYAIVAADLDGDGDVDLATANSGNLSISVLSNDGAGGFANGGTVAIDRAPYAITAADLDGDGDLDLITGNPLWDNVRILRNNGAGSFTFGSAVATGTGTLAVAAADLDGDGDFDVAAANYDGNDVVVLLNDGTGGLTAAPGSLPVGANPESIAAVDLDGDGDLDLAVGHAGSGDVSIFPNDGAAGFARGPTLSASGTSYSLIPADLDGDGDLDLAAANRTTSQVMLLVNR